MQQIQAQRFKTMSEELLVERCKEHIKLVKPIPLSIFRMMKIKMKISYEALLHGQSNAILQTHLERQLLKKSDLPHKDQDDKILSWENLLQNCNTSSNRLENIIPKLSDRNYRETVRLRLAEDIKQRMIKDQGQDNEVINLPVFSEESQPANFTQATSNYLKNQKHKPPQFQQQEKFLMSQNQGQGPDFMNRAPSQITHHPYAKSELPAISEIQTSELVTLEGDNNLDETTSDEEQRTQFYSRQPTKLSKYHGDKQTGDQTVKRTANLKRPSFIKEDGSSIREPDSERSFMSFSRINGDDVLNSNQEKIQPNYHQERTAAFAQLPLNPSLTLQKSATFKILKTANQQVQKKRDQLRRSITFQQGVFGNDKASLAKNEDDYFNQMLSDPTQVSKPQLSQLKTILLLKKETSETKCDNVMALGIKKKLYELQRFELLMKILSKKDNLSEANGEHNPIKVKNYPPSYRFYQSFDILLHKKVGDTKQILHQKAINYLQKVQQKFKDSLDRQKAMALQKSLTILKGEEQDQNNHDKQKSDKSSKAPMHRRKSIQTVLDKSQREENTSRSLSFIRKLFCMAPSSTKQKKSSKSPKPSDQVDPAFNSLQTYEGNQSQPTPSVRGQNQGEGDDLTDAQIEKMKKLLGQKEKKKITSFAATLKSIQNNQAVIDDMRIDQLRLKQLLNLKAKGFFLDHVVHHAYQKSNKDSSQQYRSNQQSQYSLNISNNNQSAIQLNRNPTVLTSYTQQNQLLKSSKDLEFNSISPDPNQKKMRAAERARKFQEKLQKQSDDEFNNFMEQFKATDKIPKRYTILQQKLDHENLFFSPAFSHVNDLRMMIKLKKNHEVTKGKSQIGLGGTSSYNIANTIQSQKYNKSSDGGDLSFATSRKSFKQKK